MTEKSEGVIEVYYSYADKDEALRNELEKHLIILYRQGLISSWHNRKITAGKEWASEIDTHIKNAQLILLLISPDFLASEYCYEIEMKLALERHKANNAVVIPILLRPVDWKHAPFSGLQALPMNGKPVASWSGRNGRDRAFLEVALGIRTAISVIRAPITRSGGKEFGTRAPIVRSGGKEFGTRISRMLLTDQKKALAFFHAHKAEKLYGSGRYEEALAIYEEALRLNPNDAVSYSGKGDALYHLKRYEEALVAYENACRLNSNDAVNYSDIGDILCQLGRYEEALVAYEEALHIGPVDAVGYSNKGDTLCQLGRYKEALVAYEAALRVNPNDPAIYQLYGDAFYNLRQYEDALNAYDKALNSDFLKKIVDYNFDVDITYKKKLEILKSLQRYDEILACCEQIPSRSNLGFDPVVKRLIWDSYDWKVNDLINQGRDQEALHTLDEKLRKITRLDNNELEATYEQILRLDPNRIDILDSKALMLRNLKRYDEVIATFDQMLRLLPNHADLYFSKGYILGLLNRYEEALPLYDQAIRLNPNHEDAHLEKTKVLMLLKRNK
jgi:tetratricopeptide (TPR) repeat protein